MDSSRSPFSQQKRDQFLSRLPILLFVLLAAAGTTFAFCEFVVWNRLPAELVGKWTVEGGPQDGATFDFSRSGSLEAHLNNNDMEHVLQGSAAVQDRTLLITTTNPEHAAKRDARRPKSASLLRRA